MTREIRMAGFGNLSTPPLIFPVTAKDGPFYNIINPGDNRNNVNRNDDQVTIIGAFEQVSTLKVIGTNTIELNGNASEFETAGNKRYICIGGIETHTVTNVSGNTITLSSNLVNRHAIGDPVFKVKAITYRLRWDLTNPNMPVLTREDNTDGGGSQVIAENVENLQLEYFDANGNITANPPDIRMVKVTVTAKTNMSDPDYKGGDGYRRRILSSNIKVRNMGL